MGRITLAFKAFFGTLFSQETANRVMLAFRNTSLQNETKPIPEHPPKIVKTSGKSRSEALILLEMLQREARFIDLTQESLDAYSNEQVGAAARNVLRDVSQTLKRCFAIEAASSISEGEKIAVPVEYSPVEYQISGNIANAAPINGSVVHRGWKATKCELPVWSGDAAHIWQLAPTEVEVA
jgi:Domain of unknown function (DUF2760)